MNPPSKPKSIPWRSLLTREAQVCRICFDAGIRPSVPLVPFSENLKLLRQNHGSFVVKRKAALKRHIADVHPTWVQAVRWES